MTLSTSSITNALSELRKIDNDTQKKLDVMCRKLAQLGADRVIMEYSGAFYDGDNDVMVSVEQTETGFKIVASGKAVAFIEFGAGAVYGNTYPLSDAGATYAVPGSWSTDPVLGKGHWDDPNGWFYAHGKRSIGNPPTAGMYYAGQEIRESIERIAKEVFG